MHDIDGREQTGETETDSQDEPRDADGWGIGYDYYDYAEHYPLGSRTCSPAAPPSPTIELEGPDRDKGGR